MVVFVIIGATAFPVYGYARATNYETPGSRREISFKKRAGSADAQLLDLASMSSSR